MQHQQLNEELIAGDLKMLVDNIFEIDSYASKMGSDKDIVVLAEGYGPSEYKNYLLSLLD